MQTQESREADLLGRVLHPQSGKDGRAAAVQQVYVIADVRDETARQEEDGEEEPVKGDDGGHRLSPVMHTFVAEVKANFKANIIHKDRKAEKVGNGYPYDGLLILPPCPAMNNRESSGF